MASISRRWSGVAGLALALVVLAIALVGSPGATTASGQRCVGHHCGSEAAAGRADASAGLVMPCVRDAACVGGAAHAGGPGLFVAVGMVGLAAVTVPSLARSRRVAIAVMRSRELASRLFRPPRLAG